MRLSKNFTALELQCPCCGILPEPELVRALQSLRDEYGKKMIIESAVRCENRNLKVGGSPTSQHLLGLAVDVRCPSDRERYRLVMIAPKHGFNGIGVNKSAVHLDLRKTPALWGY
jgi:uncharacterized protein YcbK (DUF882 family)